MPLEWFNLKMIVDFEKTGENWAWILMGQTGRQAVPNLLSFLGGYKVEKYFPCGHKKKRMWESRPWRAMTLCPFISCIEPKSVQNLKVPLRWEKCWYLFDLARSYQLEHPSLISTIVLLLDKMYQRDTSWVVQWLRHCAPTSRGWVPSLTREPNPTCCN